MKFKKNFIYEVIVNFGNFYKPYGIKYIKKEKQNEEIFIFFEIFIYNPLNAKELIKNKNFNVFFVSDFTIFYDVIMNANDNMNENSKNLRKFPSAKFEIYESIEKDDGFLIKCFTKIKKKDLRIIEKNLINRGYLCLEALILYTKPENIISKEKKIENLSEIYRVIRKTCPNSKYEKIVREIIEKSNG